MARCRTCSRDLDHLLLQNGRLVWICRCADRTTAECVRCHGPLRDAVADAERFQARCTSCSEQVVLDLDGDELERRALLRPAPEPVPEPALEPEPEPEPERMPSALVVRRTPGAGSGGYRAPSDVVVIERGARLMPYRGGLRWGPFSALVVIALIVAPFYFLADQPILDVISVSVVFLAFGLLTLASFKVIARQVADRRAHRTERVDRPLRIRIDHESLSTEPRTGEEWDGTVELDRVEKVRVVRTRQGLARVRIELDDGTERTVMDGLSDEEEVTLLVDQLEGALRARRARTGSA